MTTISKGSKVLVSLTKIESIQKKIDLGLKTCDAVEMITGKPDSYITILDILENEIIKNLTN